MSKTLKDLLIITSFALISTFLIWLPHLIALPNFYNLNFSEGFNTIFRNFDGLEYIIIAKSFYQQQLISHMPQSLPHTYYAAHFPLYAFLMLPLAPFIGFLKSMILVSLISTILAIITFYFLVKDFKLSSSPLALSLIFLILPARWLIVRSVGSSEPTFILFTLLTFYFFLKFELLRKWRFIHLAGFFGLLAQLTRPPGILIFIALSCYIFWKIIQGRTLDQAHNLTFQPQGRTLFGRIYKSITNYYPLILIPFSLILVFSYYGYVYNDFWAYFHSGDNIHLIFPPFQVFNKSEFWVGEIWLEDIIYIYILGLLAGLMLLKNQLLKPAGIYVLTFVTASLFIAHRDISRYVLPIFPFVLIAFEKVLVSKEMRIVLVVISLAIYLYAQNFLLNNTAPYPNPQLFN